MAASAPFVTWHGLDELIRGFGSATTRADEMGELGSLDAAKVVAAGAKRRAPRLTGRLAGSITTTRVGRGAAVGALASYGGFVHFGSIHNPRPVPFLYDALDASTAQMETAYRRRTDELLDRSFVGGS